VIFTNRKSPLRLMFFFLCLSVSLWGIFIAFMSIGFSQSLMSFNFKAAGWAGAFIPLFLLLFCAMFPDDKSPFGKIVLSIISIPAVIMVILSPTDLLLNNSAFGLHEITMNLGPLALYYLLYFVIYFAWSGIILFSKLKKANGFVRSQLEYLFLGLFLTSILGALCNIILVYLGFGSFVYVGPLCTCLLIGFTTYAITKTELMDIRVAITRSAAYGTVAILLATSFLILNILQMPMLLLFAANTLLCLFWVFYAERLRSLIQTPIQEKWITGWYDSNKLLNRISQKLVPVIERTEVFNLIADELKSTIKISRVEVKAGESGQKYNDLAQTKEGLVIPLSSSSGLEGLLILGQKISEDSYDEKDLTLFRILMNQAVLIFDRIKPYEQIKREFDSTQKKLFETEKMLSRSARLASLGTLTAGVTHEIRNPLGVIRGTTEDIAKTEQNKESIAGFQKLILTHVDRIANIVDKMLYLSKSKEPVTKQIDINGLIEQYVVGVVSSKNVNISTELNPVPNVSAIEDDLHQILINLTNNAIKAMPDGGNLTIKTYETKENGSSKVVIELTDTGIGIPQENLEKIFDPFFSTWENGTGLGLSISYKIIEELKGKIEVQSQVGKGSTFKIVLPAV